MGFEFVYLSDEYSVTFKRSSHLHLQQTGVCTVATNIKVHGLKLPMEASLPDSRIRAFWSVFWHKKTKTNKNSFFESSVRGKNLTWLWRDKILLNSVAVRISRHRAQFCRVLLNCVAPFGHHYFNSSYKQDIALSWDQEWKFLPFFIVDLTVLMCLLFYLYPHTDLAINLLNLTGHVMHQQFNIQQLYVLPTLYLCVLYLSENKQRFVPLTV
jgi:hypothetical protein